LLAVPDGILQLLGAIKGWFKGQVFEFLSAPNVMVIII
jgi:hypothetical protein